MVLRWGFLDTVLAVNGWIKRITRCRTDFIGKIQLLVSRSIFVEGSYENFACPIYDSCYLYGVTMIT